MYLRISMPGAGMEHRPETTKSYEGPAYDLSQPLLLRPTY